MANEFTAEMGFDKVVFLRRLSDAANLAGARLALQTTHKIEMKSHTDSTATKDGSITTQGSPETTLEVENISSDDILNDLLWDSSKNKTKLEVWEVNLAKKDVKGHYFARYMRGYVNEMQEDNDADDSSNGDASLTIDGVPQDGYLTLDEGQKAAIAYAFRGLQPITDSDRTGSGVPIATGITVDNPTLSVVAGKTGQLVATLEPSGAGDVTVWGTSDPTVATVDQKGLVTGVKEGNATISARTGVLVAISKVTVTPH